MMMIHRLSETSELLRDGLKNQAIHSSYIADMCNLCSRFCFGGGRARFHRDRAADAAGTTPHSFRIMCVLSHAYQILERVISLGRRMFDSLR